MHRLYQRFSRLYGEAGAMCTSRVAMMVNRYGVGSKVQTPAGLWSEMDSVLITYGDTICSADKAPLQTLRAFLSKRVKNAVSSVHILPFFPYSSDDGFSVIDYRKVNREFGNWSDIEAIASEYRLMTDLVLNHVSRKSAWFKDYVSGILPAERYFIEADPETDLSAVVRPRTSPLLTSTQTRDGVRHLWTTFSHDQIDLDFSNPNVLFEFLDILFYHISKGARVIRLDAIAYLWKRIGTTCIHLPETHEVVKIFRDVLAMVAPDVILITETNVPHHENISYFGKGDEAHMVYQFSLPPLLLHALQTGTCRYLREWAASLDAPPPGCTFFNFTASHDGIGVRPLEGIIPAEEFQRLLDGVVQRGGQVSTKKNEDGSESPYELNITYFSALSDRDHPDPDRHVARFMCSQAVALALQGVPAVYIQSLLATENDLAGVKRTGRARTINRKCWNEKSLLALLNNKNTPTARVFTDYTRLLRLRGEHHAFHPDGAQQILDLGDRVFAVQRTAPDRSEIVVALHNMTDGPVKITVDDRIPSLAGATKWKEITRGRQRGKAGRILSLAPYEVCWLIAPRGVSGKGGACAVDAVTRRVGTYKGCHSEEP